MPVSHWLRCEVEAGREPTILALETTTSQAAALLLEWKWINDLALATADLLNRAHTAPIVQSCTKEVFTSYNARAKSSQRCRCPGEDGCVVDLPDHWPFSINAGRVYVAELPPQPDPLAPLFEALTRDPGIRARVREVLAVLP